MLTVPVHLLLFIVCSVQKLYTVCDVAMHIIMSKSTTYSLESPKDPVLPSRFFTKPDKVGVFSPVFLKKKSGQHGGVVVSVVASQ